MSADFKSHILRRDEKGFAGVPFKRLLLSGVSGGLVYTVLRLALPEIALAMGVIVALAVVILTGTRGGLPLWLRGWLRLRGVVLLHASTTPNSLAADVARLVNVPVELARLEGETVFASPFGVTEVDLREWTTFIRPEESDHDDGLVFVDSPMSPILEVDA